MANRIEEVNGVPMNGETPKVKRGRKLPDAMVAETLPVEAKPKRKASRVTKAEKDAEAKAQAIKLKLGKVIGAIGVGLIVLSVIHCTDAIMILTNAHWTLASLLAVAIDAGMVACKVASVLVKEDDELHKWADIYVKGAIGLSVVLNIVAFIMEGNKGYVLPTEVAKGSQVLLGIAIPVLAYVLSRVVGRLLK